MAIGCQFGSRPLLEDVGSAEHGAEDQVRHQQLATPTGAFDFGQGAGVAPEITDAGDSGLDRTQEEALGFAVRVGESGNVDVRVDQARDHPGTVEADPGPGCGGFRRRRLPR